MSSKFSEILAQARNRQNDESDNEPIEEIEVINKDSADIKNKVNNSALIKTKSVSKPKALQVSKTSPALTTIQEKTITVAGTDKETVRRGRPNGKRSDPDYTQITAYITKKTHRDIKVALIEKGEGQEISEVIEECLRKWLRNSQ